VVPAVNQVELHPRLQQAELRRFYAEHGIVTEAWSPIAKGMVLDDPVITELASSYGKTPAQVVLRWHLQLGNVVIPKSVTPQRIDESLQIFDFTLDDEVMGGIEALDALTARRSDRVRLPHVVIETERLLLRPLGLADIDQFVALHDDPEVTRSLRRLERPEAEERPRLVEREWLERGHGMFALLDRASGGFLSRPG
jgi:hypothetical protein